MHISAAEELGVSGCDLWPALWHPQLCKATAVFCINTKADVFPQSHPVCAIPAALPAIPSFCSGHGNTL